MKKHHKSHVINRLVVRSFKDNKLRNSIMLFLVILITGLFTGLLIITNSVYKNLEYHYMRQVGYSSHVVVHSLSTEEADSIKNYGSIKNIGESIFIGYATNTSEFGNLPEIRYGDKYYAESFFGKPMVGRMPEQTNEIALDRTLLKDWKIEAEIGQSVTVEWKRNLSDNEVVKKDFKLTGYWDNKQNYTNEIIWVSKEFANSMEYKGESSANYSLAVVYKNNVNYKKATVDMVTQYGIQNTKVELNWAYDSNMRNTLVSETMPFFFGIVLSFLISFIILYNILHLSVTADIQFYARLKVLGASGGQVRKVLYKQIYFLALAGIPVGILLGNFFGSIFVSVLLVGKIETVFVYTNGWFYIIAVVLAFLNITLSCIFPALRAGKVTSSDGFQRAESHKNNKKTMYKSPGLPALFQLSIANVGRNKRSLITVIISLTIGIVMLGSMYVINKSFDIKKYGEKITISDFTISDQSLTLGQGNYDPKGKTITADLISQIKSQGELTEEGSLYSQEYTLELGDNTYDNIVGFYEEEGEGRLSYMASDVLWTNGYNKMKKEQSCISILYGINGLLVDAVKKTENILEGSIDLKKFYSGGYAIAQGIAGSKNSTMVQPTISVGDKIHIKDKEYEIMAIAEMPMQITQGKGSDEASFSLGFLIPDYEFSSLFPENTIRKYFFNVPSSQKKKMDNFLESYCKNKQIPYVSEKVVKENYFKETHSMTFVGWAVSILFVAIGLLNLLNSIVVMVSSRKTEFTMMQSIGMTNKQIRILLIFESLNFSLITLIIAYLTSFLVIGFTVKTYLETQWASTYTFSIVPLLIFTPILILYTVGIALLTFKFFTKKNLPDRLNKYNF